MMPATEAKAEAPGRGADEGGGTGGAQVTVLPNAVRIQARAGETVLGAALRSGFRYRWGCKRGGCGVCKVRLILGEVYYERPIAPTVLTDTERAAGVCLSCRAVPVTDLIIQLQEGDRLQGGSLRGGNSSGPSRTRDNPGEGQERRSSSWV